MTKSSKYDILNNMKVREEIKILGEQIRIDIENMPRKILDIDLIEEKSSDFTFFEIDEDENNETLKALKQSYVTSNYKDETILNLQQELKTHTNVLPKEIKLESFNKYNNALDLAQKSYITTAIKLVDEALQLNPKDEDILNLRGLLKLLKCDFAKAFESFYTAQCYGNNELSRKYVDKLSSQEFKVFLERYNHSIRFINEEMNEESIEIFNSLIMEDPELIEPYVILILLYEKTGKKKEKEELMGRLRFVDADNHLFDKNHDPINEKDLSVAIEKKERNRFLKNKDIDVELHTAGQYKRTLTLLGENTEEGRQKFREELNETHHLFKDFVKEMRPSLDIEQVATGEHWYGTQAQEKGLVDEVGTSDELLLGLMENREVISVRYTQRKKMMDRFTGSAAESADKLMMRWWQRGQKPLL